MEALRDLILATPVFPFLWVPHSILMCAALRSTLGTNRWHEFSRSHPLSCFMLGLLYIYPGGILANLVHGDPLLSFMRLGPNLYAACVCWYLVFYSPADFFFKALSTLRLMPFLAVLQDWQRIGLVLSGLETINAESPGLLLYPVVFGIIKSSGFMFIKYVEVGILQGLRTGFKVPNQATKTMIIAAVLLQLQIVYSVLPLTVSELYCILVVFAVLMRLATILLTKGDWDPYICVEQGFCSLLYGNLEPTPVQQQDKTKKEKSKKKD